MRWLIDMVQCMRISFLIAFIIVWNLLVFVAMRLNGPHQAIQTYPAAFVASFDCVLLALIAFGTLSTSSVRQFVLRQNADLTVARPGLIFIGVLGITLALIVPLSVLLR